MAVADLKSRCCSITGRVCTLRDGRPLLIATALFGNTDVVKLLVDRGADLSAKSPDVRGYTTVLSEAARTGDDSLMRMLIERGADVKTAGVAAFSNAARAGCAKCLEILIGGADRRI